MHHCTCAAQSCSFTAECWPSPASMHAGLPAMPPTVRLSMLHTRCHCRVAHATANVSYDKQTRASVLTGSSAHGSKIGLVVTWILALRNICMIVHLHCRPPQAGSPTVAGGVLGAITQQTLHRKGVKQPATTHDCVRSREKLVHSACVLSGRQRAQRKPCTPHRVTAVQPPAQMTAQNIRQACMRPAGSIGSMHTISLGCHGPPHTSAALHSCERAHISCLPACLHAQPL